MRDRIATGMLSLAIIITVACAAIISVQAVAAEQDGTFAGTWTASGQWQPLDFEEGREVFIFKLSGHVNLKNEIGEVKDFWSECVGLWDSKTGGSTRCAWRDPNGNKAAYIVISGQLVKEDVKVTGEFVGGAGTLEGLTGTLSFTWSDVYRNETDRIVTGYTKDLTGSYGIPKVGN
ncbi:MAG: hypothetical protein U9N83_06665 [Thermodesulfobacteriota bacterium]|nr:hypothetical protein [Thermodesulfobacteriota bacterium]